MADPSHGGIKEDVLTSTQVNTKPCSNTPTLIRVADAALLSSAFVARDLAKLDHVKIARRSTSAMPSCLAIMANDVDRSKYGSVSGHPRNNGMTNRHMSAQLTFKPKLESPQSTFDQSDGRLSCSVALWVIWDRSLASDVNSRKLENVCGRGHQTYNSRFVVAADAHARVAHPSNAISNTFCRITIRVVALLWHRMRKKGLSRTADPREDSERICRRLLPSLVGLISGDNTLG